MARATDLPLVFGLALLLLDGTSAVAQDPSDVVVDGAELLDPIFLDGFESWAHEGCENWSSTSTPTGGIDNDNDGYGQIAPAIVQCSPVYPPNTDCLDSNAEVYPGAFEACNQIDDDCNANSADGGDEPWLGTVCDSGADTDLCATGMYACVGGAQNCSDDAVSTVDICDGADNDCDPASPDGSEDPQVGTTCDNVADSDLCADGIRFCGDGSLDCSDDATSLFDICDGLDNDCDPASGDGSEDPLVGTVCDGQNDTDFCAEGFNSCTNNQLVCSDATGSTVEACNGDAVDEDCDGSVDEGFVLDGNPACGGFIDLGSVDGDADSTPALGTSFTEKWLLVQVKESASSSTNLRARFDLFSPVGVDFDLFLYCAGCGAAVVSSTVGSLLGHHDIADIGNDDDIGTDDTFNVLVEVRYFNSNRCANWLLTVTGNSGAFANLCGP